MARRLWDKGEPVDSLVHRFTVGNDPVIDAQLARWDCIGSAAHARMLASINIITADECRSVVSGLKTILEEVDRDGIEIAEELEDIHTAIESLLTERLGEVGKKIHTGRSRNDQVLVTMRLFLRAHTLGILDRLSRVASVLFSRIDRDGTQMMPGYTHMQPAMPSSVGMWLQAYAESLLELMQEGLHLMSAMDRNPLGAAAGFGVPLPLDREMTARLLGFSRIHRSVIDAQNSRGRYELRVALWCAEICGVFEKLASDLILYSMREFGFFSLPDALTTGSSIMPQKHNPDVLELVRARAGRVRGNCSELSWVTGKLPSHYHRDLQYSKEPAMRAITDAEEVSEVMARVLESFTVNPKALDAAMHDDLFATYDVYRSVRAGKPFREAYRDTAARIGSNSIDVNSLKDDFKHVIPDFGKHVAAAKSDLAALNESLNRESIRLESVERDVFQL